MQQKNAEDMSKKENEKLQARDTINNSAKMLASKYLQAHKVPAPIADMAVNKLAKKRIVNNGLNKISDKASKNPLFRKGLSKSNSLLGSGNAFKKNKKDSVGSIADDEDYDDESNDDSTINLKGKLNLFEPKNIKVKLIIFGIVFILLFLFFSVISTLISLGIISEDGGSGKNGKGTVYSGVGDSSYFWWPVDPIKNEDTISSYYGYRTDPVTGATESFHGGIDITGIINGRNVIASKSGKVEIAGWHSSYGNHVKIRHDDNYYTLYAHMQPFSITVSKGDYVEQGQVIGKVGTTGKSTGPHLHFEIRDAGDIRINPTDYVSMDNPRPVGQSSNVSVPDGEVLSTEFFAFLHSFEGKKEENGKYRVYADSTGTLTVGYGVTLKYNKELFASHGININSLQDGSLLEKSIVDDIEKSIKSNLLNSIDTKMKNNSIDLNVCERQALLSFTYQNGTDPLDNFVTRYKKYGNTDELYNEHFSKFVYSQKRYLSGLKKRREAEWQLFHNCKFVNNG